MEIKITKEEMEQWKQEKLEQANLKLEEMFTNLKRKEVEDIINGEPFSLSLDLSVSFSADSNALKLPQEKTPCENEKKSVMKKLLAGWLRKN